MVLFSRRHPSRSLVAIAGICLFVPAFAQIPAHNDEAELWDFTKFYDPSSLSHFAKPLSDADRGQITRIVKQFTGSRGEVRITSSVEGSFTVPHQQQTLIYASQYDDRRSMVDGTWSFYVLFYQGHAQVINGGTVSVRGERFLLRSVADPKSGLDKILVYDGWFGMQEDIGTASLITFGDLKPSVAQKIGLVYESTCGSNLSTPMTVASKLYQSAVAPTGLVRDHYIRQCGSDDFKFLKKSSEDVGDALSSVGSTKKP